MSRKPKILCVDDQLTHLKIRCIFLEQFGCEVIAVQDRQSALKAVTENDVDLLLIDYHLADGATGEEIARDVRMLRPHVPLVMFSGDPKIPESAHECSDAVLLKGASNPSDLLDVIQKLVPGAALRPRRPAPDFCDSKLSQRKTG
ncbi:MAG: response regulator [Acidobacteriaceae bacterium]|nr:response regulator [Acidobacteriaceae bacterium]